MASFESDLKAGIQRCGVKYSIHIFEWDCEYVTPNLEAPDRTNKYVRKLFALNCAVDFIGVDTGY